MRKKVDKEFNKKAVELSYVRGNTSEIAKEFGIDGLKDRTKKMEYKKGFTFLLKKFAQIFLMHIFASAS